MPSPVYNERFGRSGKMIRFWSVKYNPSNAVLGRPKNKTFNIGGARSKYLTPRHAYNSALYFSKKNNTYCNDPRYHPAADIMDVFK